MNKVIEVGGGAIQRDNLKATIQINGKDSCLDELIKTLGIRGKYIFTIQEEYSDRTKVIHYLEECDLRYRHQTEDSNAVHFRLVVSDEHDAYFPTSIKIEDNRSTLLYTLRFDSTFTYISALMLYIGSDEYKYKLYTVTGEEIECSYITEAEAKFTPDDATGVNQQKLLIHTECDNWYTVNKVEVHKIEKWVD